MKRKRAKEEKSALKNLNNLVIILKACSYLPISKATKLFEDMHDFTASFLKQDKFKSFEKPPANISTDEKNFLEASGNISKLITKKFYFLKKTNSAEQLNAAGNIW